MDARLSVGGGRPFEEHKLRFSFRRFQSAREKILARPALEKLLLDFVRRLVGRQRLVTHSQSRTPKSVVPRRTIVAPSSTAIS